VKKYEFIDHTADLGVEVYGKDLKELFENAGEALFEIICDMSNVIESVKRVITLESDDLEQLMVVWLGELLYLYDTESLLFKRFDIQSIGNKRLEAIIYGEELKAGHHTINAEIKAVTYHQIQVRQEGNRWKSRVIFDM